MFFSSVAQMYEDDGARNYGMTNRSGLSLAFVTGVSNVSHAAHKSLNPTDA